MIQTLTIGGRNLADFGVYISGEGTYNAPERSITEEVVPGRNGSLIIDNGRYQNIEVSYPAFIIRDFPRNMAGLRSYLTSLRGYSRLEDSYHPDEYRMAALSGGLDVKTSGYMNREGKFTLTFNCKPQRFLRSGEYAIPVESGATVYNPTLFDAKPLIRVYGNGSITVNGETMEWSGSSEYVDIDCDIQDCYYMGANMNSYVTGDFPVLSPEDNVIVFTGSTSVRITPRWWIL